MLPQNKFKFNRFTEIAGSDFVNIIHKQNVGVWD